MWFFCKQGIFESINIWEHIELRRASTVFFCKTESSNLFEIQIIRSWFLFLFHLWKYIKIQPYSSQQEGKLRQVFLLSSTQANPKPILKLSCSIYAMRFKFYVNAFLPLTLCSALAPFVALYLCRFESSKYVFHWQTLSEFSFPIFLVLKAYIAQKASSFECNLIAYSHASTQSIHILWIRILDSKYISNRL